MTLPNPMPRVRAKAPVLYGNGCSDRQIARALKCARKFIRQWRDEMGLAVIQRGPHRRTLQDCGEELIERGWSDGRIANELGCDRSSVRRWRHAEDIDAPCKAGSEDWYATQGLCIETNSRVMTLCEAGLTDKEGAAVLGVSQNAFECRRRRLGIKRNKVRDGRRYITGRGERMGEF